MNQAHAPLTAQQVQQFSARSQQQSLTADLEAKQQQQQQHVYLHSVLTSERVEASVQ